MSHTIWFKIVVCWKCFSLSETTQIENSNFLNFLGIKFETNRSQCWFGSNLHELTATVNLIIEMRLTFLSSLLWKSNILRGLGCPTDPDTECDKDESFQQTDSNQVEIDWTSSYIPTNGFSIFDIEFVHYRSSRDLHTVILS